MNKRDIIINNFKDLPKLKGIFKNEYVILKCTTKHEAYVITKALYKLGLKQCGQESDNFDETTSKFLNEMWEFYARDRAGYFFTAIDYILLTESKYKDVLHYCWGGDEEDACSVGYKDIVDILRKTRKEVKEYERDIR